MIFPLVLGLVGVAAIAFTPRAPTAKIGLYGVPPEWRSYGVGVNPRWGTYSQGMSPRWDTPAIGGVLSNIRIPRGRITRLAADRRR